MPKKRAEQRLDELRYAQAVAEIETILEAIDRDEIELDELSVKVERAVELINLCRERLLATELKVSKVLQGLKTDGDAPERGAVAEGAPHLAEGPPRRSETGDDLPF